jgi:4a-hydroxytetrahydrobiopterin dehydratase
MSDLTAKHCKPCEGGTAPYDAAQTKEMLSQLKGWIVEDGKHRTAGKRRWS